MGRRSSSMDMTPRQKELFHKNFRYMWDKLGTSYYYIIGPGASVYGTDRQNGINDDLHLLPAYTTCAKCYSGREDYYPSKDAVRRIVAFYNQWIRPEITVADFLNEDLSSTNDRRFRPGSMIDRRMEGVYRGYYYSQVSEKIAGAYLIIYEKKEESYSRKMKAVMITGFYNEHAMNRRELAKKVLYASEPTYNGFREYIATLKPDASRQDYYEGDVEMNGDVMFITFRRVEREFGRMSMMINTSAFPDTEKFSRPNDGGLAYVLSTENSGIFPAFFTCGFARDKVFSLDMEDPDLAEKLKVPDKPYLLRLRPSEDKKWIQYIRKTKNTEQ